MVLWKGECMNENNLIDKMSGLVGEFINQCGAMAEENWLPSQVEMLERLFGAVLNGCKYDEWEPVEMRGRKYGSNGDY